MMLPVKGCSSRHQELWRSSLRRGGLLLGTHLVPRAASRHGLWYKTLPLASGSTMSLLTFRNNQGVALGQRSNVQEREYGFRLDELVARDLSFTRNISNC